jgi:hypothetical protein
MNKTLLIKIKECIGILEQHKGDLRIANEVASYILSEPNFLNESDEATRLVNALADVIEGRELSMDKVVNAFSLYWISLISITGITLFYIGHADNLNQFKKYLDAGAVSDIHHLNGNGYSPEEAARLAEGISAAVAPVIIYDPFGARFVQQANPARALAVIPYYDLMFSTRSLTSEIKYSHAAWLESKYQMANNPSVETVVIGNSYGYYAFPEQSTRRAVNLSMHSLSIKQAHALVFHALDKLPYINNFVFCFGLFDLYSDLLKTKDDFNKTIIDSISLFFANNNIVMPMGPAAGHILTISSLIIPPRTNVNETWPDGYLHQAYGAAYSLINSKDHLDPQQHHELATIRARAHSKLAGHGAIFQENQKLLREMVEALHYGGKTAAWVVPPFPAMYVRHIDERMKRANREALAQFGDDKLRFIDWSESGDFERQHFRDGDHLNFSGAKKVVIKLRKAGIAV